MFARLLKSTDLIILTIILAITVAYSFSLALKRYNNYEFGKFDLGNMSQMVWNSSRGRVMEITDQFGTNMPRWGMSHVDPILLFFVPIYWVYAHPMVLVFGQHLLMLSAIYPIFFLTQRKTKNKLLAYIFVLTYILYPAVGYSLVWTTFHGISFVSSLLIWLIYFLERKDFLKGIWFPSKSYLIYWTLIILMLLGKEEIGFILGLGAFPLFFKNRKLAIQTFIICIAWSLTSFLMIIPAYSEVRKISVENFISEANISDTDAVGVTGDNFFLARYAYLGDSYSDIILGIFTHPEIFSRYIFSDDNILTIRHLLEPFMYIGAIVPFWIISAPDLAILLLSDEKIFFINNHRIAFIITTLFISYFYLMYWLDERIKHKNEKYKYAVLVFSILVLISTIWSSSKSDNPMYTSGVNLIREKILTKIMAQGALDSDNKVPGDISKSKLPENSKECMNYAISLVNKYNPQVYTGPDYLGAHTSLRRVNALFPGRITDAEMVIVELFDDKPLQRVRAPHWAANKIALRNMFEDGNFKHIYSCDRINIFVRGENEDLAKIVDAPVYGSKFYRVDYRGVDLGIAVEYLPSEISVSSPSPIKLIFKKYNGDFNDKFGYWIFKDSSGKKSSFVDYTISGYSDNIENAKPSDSLYLTYMPQLANLTPGKYEIYYGIGNLVDTREIYLGDIKVTD